MDNPYNYSNPYANAQQNYYPNDANQQGQQQSYSQPVQPQVQGYAQQPPQQPVQPGAGPTWYNPPQYSQPQPAQQQYAQPRIFQPTAGQPDKINIDAGTVLQAASMAGHQVQGYQALFKQGMSYMTGETVQSYFQVNPKLVMQKLLLLHSPYLRRWRFDKLIPASNNNPAHQTSNQSTASWSAPPPAEPAAPELYIPIMAACTYCLLSAMALTILKKFSVLKMYSAVSTITTIWVIHALAYRLTFSLLRLRRMPGLMDTIAFSGYVFVPACTSVVLQTALTSNWWGRGWVLYGGLCMSVLTARTLKRLLYNDEQAFGGGGGGAKVFILGLTIAQIPLQLLLWILVG